MRADSSKKKVHVQKRLSDFFPEEHIIVTSGIVLAIVAFVALVPQLSSRGLFIKVASVPLTLQTMSFTLWDAFAFGALALIVVFSIVYLVRHFAVGKVESNF